MSPLDRHPDARVDPEPFPHLVIDDYFPPDRLADLLTGFPPVARFRPAHGRQRPMPRRGSVKGVLNDLAALADPALPAIWRELIAAHTDISHLRAIARLFDAPLAERYPALHARLAHPEELRVGQRGRDRREDHDLLLQCSFVMHTPNADRPRTDRGPHVKITDKPFEAQVFLASPSDTTSGGGLELYRPRAGHRPRFGHWNSTGRAGLELVKTIPYRCNRAVLCLNVPEAIQRWEPRGVGSEPLRYFNFQVQAPAPLFALPMTRWHAALLTARRWLAPR